MPFVKTMEPLKVMVEVETEVAALVFTMMAGG
jgi:hypothetical protein